MRVRSGQSIDTPESAANPHKSAIFPLLSLPIRLLSQDFRRTALVFPPTHRQFHRDCEDFLRDYLVAREKSSGSAQFARVSLYHTRRSVMISSSTTGFPSDQSGNDAKEPGNPADPACSAENPLGIFASRYGSDAIRRIRFALHAGNFRVSAGLPAVRAGTRGFSRGPLADLADHLGLQACNAEFRMVEARDAQARARQLISCKTGNPCEGTLSRRRYNSRHAL
jgi:hypothetical protein